MRESGAGGGPAADQRGPLSPVWAFILLGAVATIVPLALLATRPGAARSTPPATRSPDYSLTDAEAIAEFERLNESLMAAYRERNIALAESIFTTDSPMLPRVRKEIDRLLDSSIVSRTQFEELSTEVISRSNDEMALERIEIVRPHFETEKGKNVSGPSMVEKERVEWQLRLENGRWLLHNAVVVERTKVKAAD